MPLATDFTPIVRERDVIVLAKSKGIPVEVDPTLAASGWAGGQGVSWVDSTSDTLIVSFSTGLPAGFLLWGSNESSDQFISYIQNQPLYRFATLCFGGWMICTKTFEQFTYQSRQSGPLVPITYAEGEPLFFSLRGLFTNQDEWALSGDPRAPNIFGVGVVAQAPSSLTNGYITIETQI